MSTEIVETTRRTYEAWNRGDREAWLAFGDPNVELDLPIMERLEAQGRIHGLAGAAQFWETWHATFPNASFEVEGIRDLGDTAFVAVRLRGRGAQSEAPFEQKLWHLVTWLEGKIILFRSFLLQDEALEAAGLSE